MKSRDNGSLRQTEKKPYIIDGAEATLFKAWQWTNVQPVTKGAQT